VTLLAPSRSSVRPRSSTWREDEHNSASIFQSLARALLITTICAAPWAFGAVQSWAWGTLMVLSLLTLVLWAIGCALSGVLKVAWSPLTWPFVAFLVLATVQFASGLTADRVATREALLKLTTNFVFFFLAGQLLNTQPENERALKWFGPIVSLLALALCLEGLAQTFLGGDLRVIYWTYRASGAAFGPYVNHNNYAGLMEMLLSISVAFILSRFWNPLFIFLSWCGFGLGIISIWISGSRGATIVLLLEALIWAGLLMWNRPQVISPRLVGVVLGVLLITGATFSYLISTGRAGGRAWSVFETNRSLEVKLGDRLGVAVDTLRMVRSHPWLGVGVGCFESAFPSYLTFVMDRHWAHAHDDLLEAAAETGLPGAALILVSIVIFIRVVSRDIKRRLRSDWDWIQVGAAIGAVGLFFHSFVDFNLRVPANAAWFVVCVAVATHVQPTRAIFPKDF
jgi:O-antigen ligase